MLILHLRKKVYGLGALKIQDLILLVYSMYTQYFFCYSIIVARTESEVCHWATERVGLAP